MARYPGFSAGSFPARSRTVDCESTKNLIVEALPQGATPKRNPAMYNRPGLTAWTSIAPGPIRAMFWQDGRFFAVSGGFFYELFQSRNVALRGAVRADGRPATISSNGTGGNQLFITSGGLGYIYSLTADTLTQITDVNFPNPVAMGLYMDGYFVALQGQSNRFQLSDLMDGLVWNGLDIAAASLTSDRKVAMGVTDRKLVLFGTKATEPWYDSGAANFPFEPFSGIVVAHGIAAPFSVVDIDNTLYWLGQDTFGRGIVWKFTGWTPERVSNHALESVLQQLPSIDNVIAFGLQMDGHAFYALFSPYAESTWMFDVSVGTWTEWNQWDNRLMRYVPFIGQCQAAGWNQQFIGSRKTGTYSGIIYTLDMQTYTDQVVWPVGA